MFLKASTAYKSANEGTSVINALLTILLFGLSRICGTEYLGINKTSGTSRSDQLECPSHLPKSRVTPDGCCPPVNVEA